MKKRHTQLTGVALMRVFANEACKTVPYHVLAHLQIQPLRAHTAVGQASAAGAGGVGELRTSIRGSIIKEWFVRLRG